MHSILVPNIYLNMALEEKDKHKQESHLAQYLFTFNF